MRLEGLQISDDISELRNHGLLQLFIRNLVFIISQKKKCSYVFHRNKLLILPTFVSLFFIFIIPFHFKESTFTK